MYSTHVYYATHCPGWGGEGGRNLKRKGNEKKEQQRGHQMQRRGERIKRERTVYTLPSLKPSELFFGHGIIDQWMLLHNVKQHKVTSHGVMLQNVAAHNVRVPKRKRHKMYTFTKRRVHIT
jgi:hypothetical protein